MTTWSLSSLTDALVQVVYVIGVAPGSVCAAGDPAVNAKALVG